MTTETPSTAARRVGLALVAVATGAAEAAAAPPGRHLVLPLLMAVLLTGIAAVGSRWLRPRHPGSASPPARAFFGLVAVLLLPLPLEPAFRATGYGSAPEHVLLACLRNLALGLVVLSAWPVCQRLAALAAVFAALFASATADGPAAPVLAAVAAGAGTLWLLLAYWDGGRNAFAATGATARLPKVPVVVVFLVVGGCLAFGTATSQRAASALGELMPTSGGTGAYDPYSRGGLNDGDEETRGTDQARSVGFAESDTLLEDDRPSLYDALTDQYGESRAPKERQKAVAVDARALAEPRHRPAENLRAGREFSTSRRGPAEVRPPGDRAADALLYVAGRTPLHLRMAVYDRFDGVAWQEAARTPTPFEPAVTVRERWMYLPCQGPDVFADEVRHQIKVGKLRAEVFATPPHLTAFRLGRVDRPDFFALANEGILRLRQRAVPAGVTLETESRVPDPDRLRDLPWTPADPSVSGETGALVPISPDVIAVARHWAGDAPPGWRQVEALVAALRAHATADRRAVVPTDCEDTVAHFLLESRRGPDYLFATSAAVLLRSLGYETRLVSGFYAAPARYDPATDHTPIGAEDVHFWAEVRLRGDAWTPVEATPGYELAAPRPSPLARLRAALAAAGHWAAGHGLAVSAGLAGFVALLWRRRWVVDSIAVAAWHLRAGGSWRQSVLRAFRLLERRGRWVGQPRRAGQTPCRWCGSFQVPAACPAQPLLHLAALADWAVHAPPDCPPPCEADEVRRVCRVALREWSVSRFHRVSRGNLIRQRRPWLVGRRSE